MDHQRFDDLTRTLATDAFRHVGIGTHYGVGVPSTVGTSSTFRSDA